MPNGSGQAHRMDLLLNNGNYRRSVPSLPCDGESIMIKTTRRQALLLSGALLAGAALSPAPTAAQTFPTRPITMVVPFAAGGSTDVVARIIAQKMSEGLGQQVIIENVAGAGGSTGAARVVKAEPDGYTILMGTVATHALNPLMLKRKPYDAVTDFMPVSLLVIVPNVLVVHPSTTTRPQAWARRCISRASCSRASPKSPCSTSPTAAPDLP
jgi:hypothetical protein